MSFWSGEKLETSVGVVENFDKKYIDVNAYNLTIGNTYFRTIDDPKVEAKKQTVSLGDSFVIPPGQFAFLLSAETVHVPPSAMAFISMKTMVKFQGLINVSGFHVDPGYNGRLMFSVYNASPSPIPLTVGDPLFKIWFSDLDRTSQKPYLFDGRSISGIPNELIRGMSREILSLQSLSDKIRDIEHSIKEELAQHKPVIDNLTFVWRAVTIAVVGGLVLALLSVAWPILQALGTSFADWVSP